MNATTASTTLSSITSSAASNWSTILIIVLLIISIALYSAAFVKLSSFSGSTDSWNDIKTQISPIIGEVVAGTVIASIGAILFFTQSPAYAQNFAIGMSICAFGMSFAAVAVGTMTR